MKIPRLEFTVPNVLSISRIIFIPLFLFLLSKRTPESWIWALGVFTLASLTDLFDGWAARKLNQESEFGKFIDPLADKFLVVSALLALMILDPYLQIFDLWMILIIAGRDVLITIMRFLAIKKGQVLKTSHFGKVKTFFQMGSIVIIIMIYIAKKTKVFHTNDSLPYWIMFGVTILTAISGFRYLLTNWQLFLNPKKKDE